MHMTARAAVQNRDCQALPNGTDIQTDRDVLAKVLCIPRTRSGLVAYTRTNTQDYFAGCCSSCLVGAAYGGSGQPAL